jgi:MFS family permease
MIADAWGRRKSMMVAMINYLISFLFFYIADSFLIYMLAMIAFGFAEAFRSGTHKAMIVDYLKQNQMTGLKTRYYGSTRSWSQMGSSIAAIGGALALFVTGNYKLIFLITVVPYILNFFLIWSYPKSLDHKSETGIEENLFQLIKKTLVESGKTFLNFKIIKILFSSSTIIGFFKSLKDYIQPLISILALSLTLNEIDNHISDVQKESILIGLIYSIIFIITSLTSRFAYKFEAKIGKTGKAANQIYLAAGLAIAFSGFMAYYEMQLIAIILFLGLYVAQNLRRPIMVTYISERVPQNILATGLSAESQLKTLIIVIVSPVLGLIIDNFSLAEGIIICGLIILLLYPLNKLKD